VQAGAFVKVESHFNANYPPFEFKIGAFPPDIRFHKFGKNPTRRNALGLKVAQSTFDGIEPGLNSFQMLQHWSLIILYRSVLLGKSCSRFLGVEEDSRFRLSQSEAILL
jgi:hypothetical protein